MDTLGICKNNCAFTEVYHSYWYLYSQTVIYTRINFKCIYSPNIFSLASAPVLRYTILVEILKLLQQNSLPCYHPDNKMITGGCTGSGIGMPQRIRAITWNRTHINYTECVKSERVGIRYALRKATQSLSFSDSIPDCGNDWTTVFMIHKRELSDSMIESVSSLFYCVPHHQRNLGRFFRSAGISLCFSPRSVGL